MRPSTRTIKIAHLYPDVMDLYGDAGNVLALARRCEWRGISVEFQRLALGESAQFSGVDLIVMGGGQDSSQALVAPDLQRHGHAIRDAIDGGAAALSVCAGFQLFGTEYQTAGGATLPGIGVFEARTQAGARRVVGDAVVDAKIAGWGDPRSHRELRLVGFENHAGKTTLSDGAIALGCVVTGGGNQGDGMLEGAVYRNAIGTYLHGPLLPRNPALADFLIEAALAHRYGEWESLRPLDDAVELRAREAAGSGDSTARASRLSAGR